MKDQRTLEQLFSNFLHFSSSASWSWFIGAGPTGKSEREKLSLTLHPRKKFLRGKKIPQEVWPAFGLAASKEEDTSEEETVSVDSEFSWSSSLVVQLRRREFIWLPFRSLNDDGGLRHWRFPSFFRWSVPMTNRKYWRKIHRGGKIGRSFFSRRRIFRSGKKIRRPAAIPTTRAK